MIQLSSSALSTILFSIVRTQSSSLRAGKELAEGKLSRVAHVLVAVYGCMTPYFAGKASINPDKKSKNPKLQPELCPTLSCLLAY